MKGLLIIAATLFTFFLAPSTFAHPTPPTGFWETFDDSDRDPTSIVEVREINGQLQGKIVKLFLEPGAPSNPICKKCPGKYKNMPLLGMTILWGLSPKNDEWINGHMLSPKKGQIVKASAKLTDDDTLKVRGYKNAFLSKTVTWKRVKNPNNGEN